MGTSSGDPEQHACRGSLRSVPAVCSGKPGCSPVGSAHPEANRMPLTQPPKSQEMVAGDLGQRRGQAHKPLWCCIVYSTRDECVCACMFVHMQGCARAYLCVCTYTCAGALCEYMYACLCHVHLCLCMCVKACASVSSLDILA